ncbi:methyltransferase domain-containing protein [Ferrovibrio terrae]|uniref:Methyltransferase domain-containing protein n=1 Tax=Ferrovibrio terrae TaxID=2594003 RepID=A0A516H289_9PROT|nr:methyltransferase domain-containing protein [Ferrovibrio terrae]QDO97889.1 methyltransferase domain-containing protein [Ferrovibrio terrae]
MNRKERRAQKKSGGGGGPVRQVPAARSNASAISDMLLGLGGVQKVVPAETPVAAAVDPVHSALAQLRLGETLATKLDRLQVSLATTPNSESLLYQVARLQVRLDRRADALITYRRMLALDPGHAEARHMVAVLAGEVPEKANEAYVAALFDAFADSFDEKLVGWLDYCAPQHVAVAVRAALGEGKVAARGIDLGCGTGLLAPELRGLVKHLDGVDLSPKMVEKARARKMYDALTVGEIVAELGKHHGGYDLVAAADVLSYFGDLRALFDAVRAALPDDGLFVATVEKGVGARYQAGKSGRYQHGEAYLRKRAAEAGFVVLSLEEIELRKEENRPVVGYVFALRAQETPESQSAKLSATSLDDLVAGLTAPQAAAVAAAAQRMIGKGFSIGWAIDLGGCLAPQAADLRTLAQHLDMVSEDPARSRRAFETGLYDDCDSDAVIAFLENRPDHYDLIMSADPAIVRADPAAFFSAVKIALALAGVFIGVFGGNADALGEAAKAEGLFLLATEPLPDGSVCLIAES